MHEKHKLNTYKHRAQLKTSESINTRRYTDKSYLIHCETNFKETLHSQRKVGTWNFQTFNKRLHEYGGYNETQTVVCHNKQRYSK